uniref:Uncharacterized protein n=1 Tax=Oryza sativa subsp. japonica TaxID=39947 RepID=Q7EYC4_ORYSJ|nr:hypothetical protein [Oryza sativa Japonica Group]
MDRWATRRCAAIDSLAHGMDNVLLGKVAARGNLPCLEKIADGEVDKEVTIVGPGPGSVAGAEMKGGCAADGDGGRAGARSAVRRGRHASSEEDVSP